MNRVLSSADFFHEIYEVGGVPRAAYAPVLDHLKKRPPAELRQLDQQMEATLREMGVTFGHHENQAWVCDLLPHIFEVAEWRTISAGVEQRLRAFELFLEDVYGPRRILREGKVPVHPVLGSPHYQTAIIGLPRANGFHLHFSGICLTRDARGTMMVKHHYLSRAPGLAYMMQNRRVLARVLPEIFENTAVRSFAETPLAILEMLRGAAPEAHSEPSIVLLSPGVESPVLSAHGFLARRMGVPLVQGGDLVVLDDAVYLKTVEGLKKVDVIYNRVPDECLDPLVLRRNSELGVPGLIHCMRKGTVAVLNAPGSELADDRSLLCFAATIIRFYLAEDPILPTVPTFWLGDIDQQEMVMEKPEAFIIREIFGNDLAGSDVPDLAPVRKRPSHFIAQPIEYGGRTVRAQQSGEVDLAQDHILFALRAGGHFNVFPGALTRVFPRANSAAPWISRDTWVLGENPEQPGPLPRASTDMHALLPPVTSRVAESLYWMGRYLERAYHRAYLIQVIETLETEELNSAERKLYRPMWNRLLPPLEKSAGESRRSITTWLDRYRLLLLPEPGTVVSTLEHAISNAESLQEILSPEAWSTLANLRARFQRNRYRENTPEQECGRIARRLSDRVTRLIPQFFAISTDTMLADDGWRFCEVGQMIERAINTANSVVSISKGLAQAREIELSAFLRLLGTRDAYRRVYQMRAEQIPVLEILWQNAQAPRSVLRCLQRCARLLREGSAVDTVGRRFTLEAIDDLLSRIQRVNWNTYLTEPRDESDLAAVPVPNPEDVSRLTSVLAALLAKTAEIHDAISDGFLSHQISIGQAVQPELKGL